MGLDLSNYEERTREAVAHFWRSGEQAVTNQALKGKKDQGNQGRSTAETNMDGFVGHHTSMPGVQESPRANYEPEI